MDDPRRSVPRTDAVLSDRRVRALLERHHEDLVRAAVRTALAEVRSGEASGGPDAVAERAVALVTRPGLGPVVNATGVIVHTNLGRAPLDPAAVAAVVAAAGTTALEFDLHTGRRGVRSRGAVDALLARLPAAGDALVVTNNAAALLLAVTALAGVGGAVLISRGELVEIGDGFRLPDLMTSSGARLLEVGTTNRTTLRDYADAAAGAACIVRIHPSNFRVTGFTHAVPVEELAGLGLPVVVDLGSGLLAPEPGLPEEPDAAGALAAGADLVLFSGDKLLGGPQAGVVAGRAELVERLRRHPLARALRPDKLTLAALEATLRAAEPPVLSMLRADADGVRERAERLAALLAAAGVQTEVIPSTAVVGGGGAPGVRLPSAAVALDARWARPLRLGRPAVVGRIEAGRLLLDARTLADDQVAVVASAVAAITTLDPPS